MNTLNWKSGAPKDEGRYLVKGVAGMDPARIFEAQVRRVARGITLFLRDIDETVREKDMNNAFYVRTAQPVAA